MGALADMLAGAPSGDDGEDKDAAGGDAKQMGVASLKAMFEAAKSGDFDAAFDHLCAAMGHAEKADAAGAYDEPDSDEGGSEHGKAPALVIAMGPHKR
jgi:hypothetical protein